MEGDSNLACFTYENVLMKEETWADQEVVWLMGQRFQLPDEKGGFLDFMRSRLWFTYRKGFDAIGGTGPTSDSSWGCMLRCGQMILAQALLRLKIISKYPNWKWRENELQNEKYYEVLKSFADVRSSCYSIQQIAQMGVQEGKNVGEWFGPNTVAQVLKKLSAFDDCNDIAIYVAMDNTICKQDAENICSPAVASNQAKCAGAGGGSSAPGLWKPLLLIIPLRLGLSDINPLYFDTIKNIFTWKECVGVIGGKPNHAYYFVGSTETNSLVFLDPHTTQQSVNWNGSQLDASLDSTYHCESPGKMPISELDPSLALGFLCAGRSDFEDFCSRVQDQQTNKNSHALFSVVENLPACNIVESRIVSVSVHNRDKKKNGDRAADENACLTLDSDEDLDDVDEDFEILDIL